MTRGGGFGGFGLDPFGAGGGNLGRYNLGETVGSLEALEAYTIAVGWANGTVTDEDYLASLKKQIDLAPEGSHDKIAAQDKYDDAVYTIARNKIVNQINAADTSAERVALTKQLIAHDQARLGAMQPSNEQYRELQTKIASERADIRASQYGDLVERVNRGHASTSDLLAMAQKFYGQATGDPDEDQWRKTMGELRDRVADERLQDGYQAYQHNRMSGQALLRLVDARLAELTPGSPAYRDLHNQREDLADNVKQHDRGIRMANLQKAKNEGKIKDSAYIAALRKDLADQKPGTQDAIDAANRLRQAVFSLGEDKLRYDVQKGKAGSVDRLIRFYKSYQATMVSGSSEWRAVDLAISSLRGRGGSGGGGGRGGSGGGKAYTAGYKPGVGIPKVIPAAGDFGTLASGNLPGVKVPKDLAHLLTIDPANKRDAKWFDNNRRSMTQSYQAGDDTWVYFGRDGSTHVLPFTPGMLTTIEQQNVRYHAGLVGAAKDGYKAQVATGAYITALSRYRDHGGQMAMDDYTKSMGLINGQKERALAAGDYALYVNLTLAQQQIIRGLLGIPEGAPTDVSLATNPVLDSSMRDRIARDLDKIEPGVDDPTEEGYHPNGDPVLAAINEGSIQVRDADGDGLVDTAKANPEAGYVTQDPTNGQVTFHKLNKGDQSDWYVDENGDTKPAYLRDTVRVNTAQGVFYQPIQHGGALAAQVRITEPPTITVPPTQGGPAGGPPLGAGVGGFFQLPQPAADRPQLTKPAPYSSYASGVSVDLPGISVQEVGPDGKKRTVWWVTLDGVTYLRMEAGAGGKAPEVLINEDKSGRVKVINGTLTVDGKAYDPQVNGSLSQYLHFYGTSYVDGSGKVVTGQEGRNTGKAGWGVGAQGQFLVPRKIGQEGLDTTFNPDPTDEWEDQLFAAQRNGLGMSKYLQQKGTGLSDHTYDGYNDKSGPEKNRVILEQGNLDRANQIAANRAQMRLDPEDRYLLSRSTLLPKPGGPIVNAQTGFVIAKAPPAPKMAEPTWPGHGQPLPALKPAKPLKLPTPPTQSTQPKPPKDTYRNAPKPTPVVVKPKPTQVATTTKRVAS